MECNKDKIDFISSRVEKIIYGSPFHMFSFFDGYPDLNRVEIVSTYPEKWVHTYSERKLFLIDPVIKYSRNNVKPFFWEENFFPDEKAIFKLSNDYSISAGASFILHVNNGHLCVLSFANIDKDGEFVKEINRNKNILQMHLIELCNDIQYNFHAKGSLNQGILSHREFEVLQWISFGKTQEETGILMNISTRTVKFHINNIFNKLDVNNVSYAVRKAMMLNLL